MQKRSMFFTSILLLANLNVPYCQDNSKKPEDTIRTWYHGFNIQDKKLIENTLWKYTSVHLNGPYRAEFDIVKTDTLEGNIFSYQYESTEIKLYSSQPEDVIIIVEEDFPVPLKKWFLLRKRADEWKIVEFSKFEYRLYLGEPQNEILYFYPQPDKLTAPKYKVRLDTLDIYLENIKILLVDDEEDLREMAKRILERRGFKVVIAGSGETAIDVFEKHADQIKLVILDMILPEGDGKKVYNKIKELKHDSKIILTSGYIHDAPFQKLIENNRENFLPKPWDLPDLIQEAERVLETA